MCYATDASSKTLQATALMVNHRPDRDARRRTTLIVVPLSLLSQWPQELESKVRSGHRLRVGIYHGAGKNAGELLFVEIKCLAC